MTQPAPTLRTYAEYLAAERASATKHEYLRGEVYAMAGGTPEHARLAARVIGELARLLGDGPCEPFTSDLRVRVVATDLSTYPDVTVVCGPPETAADDPDAVVNPTVIVEVLSDSTEAYDRGEKFAHYRRLPSLREYVLVSQHAPRIEVFRRRGEREWSFSEARAGEAMTLESLGVEIDVDTVYRARVHAS